MHHLKQATPENINFPEKSHENRVSFDEMQVTEPDPHFCKVVYTKNLNYSCLFPCIFILGHPGVKKRKFLQVTPKFINMLPKYFQYISEFSHKKTFTNFQPENSSVDSK